MMRTILGSILAIGMVTNTFAQGDLPSADRIEEDWELVVAEPDLSLLGPQITIVMRPTSDNPLQAQFKLNYRDHPTFEAGGLQIQLWQGGEVSDVTQQSDEQLHVEGETITWTQRMSLANGAVEFQILSGQSETWGDFGQEGQLGLSNGSAVGSLAGYSPNRSVEESGVSFQANLVTSLRLVQVRYYQGDTLLSTDDQARSVDLSK